MPLLKSKSAKAQKQNIKTEYKALRNKGVTKKKAVKQAVAISYSVKRKK